MDFCGYESGIRLIFIIDCNHCLVTASKNNMEHQEEMKTINRIRDGETALFSLFLEQYGSQVHSMIGHIIPCKEDAEELTQDAFVKAFCKLSSFKGDCKFSTWLYRIAYNTAISATRKKKIILPVIDESIIEKVADEAVDSLLDQHENEEVMVKLEGAVNCLVAEDKALIALFYNEGKSLNELSEILQLSVSNVKVKLHRVRKKLYVMIKEYKNEAR